MSRIIFDGVEYETENLSKEAINELQMVRLVDDEIKRLQGQLAIAQTARIAYVAKAKRLLDSKN